MFGVIVAGRLVQTDFQQVSENQFVINIPEADNVNHIVIFMTGQTPFPEGVGGGVYFCWPSAEGPSWHMLGFITNEKPSAIFKVSGLKSDGESKLTLFGQAAGQPTHMAQIGISVEPIDQLSQMTPASHTNVSTQNSFVEFSNKMLENFYNFVASFAVSQAQIPDLLAQQQGVSATNETFVPGKAIQLWFENYRRRLEQNPNFWKL